ncbi:hypothetical protein AMTRI_Chr03g51220 [Amborella trichopoda]
MRLLTQMVLSRFMIQRFCSPLHGFPLARFSNIFNPHIVLILRPFHEIRSSVAQIFTQESSPKDIFSSFSRRRVSNNDPKSKVSMERDEALKDAPKADAFHDKMKNFRDAETVTGICDMLRKGGNWDDLSLCFGVINLNEAIIEHVLLNLKELNEAKLALSFFHWSSLCKKIDHGLSTYCIIVHILVRSELFTHAQALLESAVKKHCIEDFGFPKLSESLLGTYYITGSSFRVFDFLVQTYARLRMFDEAISSYSLLEKYGFSPSIVTWNILLNFVQKSNQSTIVWRIYEDMLMRRTYPNVITVRTLTNELCKEGKLQKFLDLVNMIQRERCDSGVIVNVALIDNMFREKKWDQGIVFLRRMVQKNMILDKVAYSLIINGFCEKGDLVRANEMHEDFLKKGFPSNSFTCTSFIGLYCKKGKFEEVNRLMKEMVSEGLKPYDMTYNFLIEGLCKLGKLEESLNFYEEMIRMKYLPSVCTFNELAFELCKLGKVDKANGLLTDLLDMGFSPDEITYCLLIDGYNREGHTIQEALKLYYEMEFKGPSPGHMAYSLLIGGLCRWGKVKEAEKFLKVYRDKLLSPTKSIYNTLIIGHCESGNIEKALYYYDEMIRDGLVPDSRTLRALAELANKDNTLLIVNEVFDGLANI